MLVERDGETGLWVASKPLPQQPIPRFDEPRERECYDCHTTFTTKFGDYASRCESCSEKFKAAHKEEQQRREVERERQRERARENARRVKARRAAQEQAHKERMAALASIIPEQRRLAGPIELIYRCYGAGQELLYIGRTVKGQRRILAHAEKGWFEREVEVVTFERVLAEDAATQEAAAIRQERPKYNVMHAGNRR